MEIGPARWGWVPARGGVLVTAAVIALRVGQLPVATERAVGTVEPALGVAAGEAAALGAVLDVALVGMVLVRPLMVLHMVGVHPMGPR